MPRAGDDDRWTENPWEVGKARYTEDEEKCPHDGCVSASGHDGEHQLGAGGYDQNAAAVQWVWWLACLFLVIAALVIGGAS